MHDTSRIKYMIITEKSKEGEHPYHHIGPITDIEFNEAIGSSLKDETLEEVVIEIVFKPKEGEIKDGNSNAGCN